MPGAATVQPAALARGLRRVLLERGVRHPRGHDAPSRSTASGRAGSAAWAPARAGRRRRRGTAGGLRPVRVRTTSRRRRGRGPGRLGGRGAQRLGRRRGRGSGRRLVTWSSYIVLTEPIPDRLAEIGWTGGEGLADAPLHAPLPAHDPRRPDRHRWRRRAGPGSAAGSAPRSPTIADAPPRARPGCAGCSRRCATSGSRTPGAARSTSAPTTCRGSGRVRGRPIHYGHGYSGNGVGPSLVGGRILAARALERADDPALALPLADGRPPRAFPPEPARYLGARLIREAAVRRETPEERGEDARAVLRELSAGLPRRLGLPPGAGLGAPRRVRSPIGAGIGQIG